MAVITSVCGAMRRPEHQMALITSGIVVQYGFLMTLIASVCVRQRSGACCSC